MRGKTLLIVFIFLNVITNAKNQNSDSLKIILLNKEVAGLNDKLTLLNTDVANKINYQNSIVQTSFNGMSTQISATSIFLTIFSIVITLIAIVIGIYISRVQKNVQSILEANEKIKKDVIDLNTMIQNDMTSLYSKLQAEETKSVIKRLLDVPEDIENIGKILLARQISTNEYANLKQAYLNCKKKFGNNSDITGNFQILLFQHFTGQSFVDPDIQKDIESNLNRIISVAFENDIVQYTSSMIKEYLNETLHKNRVNIFLRSIMRSEFSDNQDIW